MAQKITITRAIQLISEYRTKYTQALGELRRQYGPVRKDGRDILSNREKERSEELEEIISESIYRIADLKSKVDAFNAETLIDGKPISYHLVVNKEFRDVARNLDRGSHYHNEPKTINNGVVIDNDWFNLEVIDTLTKENTTEANCISAEIDVLNSTHTITIDW